MKTLIAASMLVFGMAVANAQPGGGPGGQRMNPEQMAKSRADRMKEVVKLTDAQYAKVLALYKEESEAMQKAMGNGQPDREAMQKMREEQETKLKEILTAEQYKTWSESDANRRGPGGGPGGPGGPGGGPGGPGN